MGAHPTWRVRALLWQSAGRPRQKGGRRFRQPPVALARSRGVSCARAFGGWFRLSRRQGRRWASPVSVTGAGVVASLAGAPGQPASAAFGSSAPGKPFTHRSVDLQACSAPVFDPRAVHAAFHRSSICDLGGEPPSSFDPPACIVGAAKAASSLRPVGLLSISSGLSRAPPQLRLRAGYPGATNAAVSPSIRSSARMMPRGASSSRSSCPTHRSAPSACTPPARRARFGSRWTDRSVRIHRRHRGFIPEGMHQRLRAISARQVTDPISVSRPLVALLLNTDCHAQRVAPTAMIAVAPVDNVEDGNSLRVRNDVRVA